MVKLISTKPVSLFWQTVFVFTIDVFAFYRIQKLRRWLLLVVIPAILTNIPVNIFFPTDIECESDWWLFFIYDTCQELEIQIFTGIVTGLFLVYSIYLVRKWSMQWNKQFEV